MDAFCRDKTEEAAGLGTLMHYWKETGDSMPSWASEKDIELLHKKLDQSGTKREDYWRPGEGEHEISFALMLDTLELTVYTGPRDGADAWKKSFERALYLTGTFDWVHWGTEKTLPWVDDLKTGHWVEDPKKSTQLRSYLLVPWVKDGHPTKWEGVASITQWEKYPLAGKPKRKAARLTGLDMLTHLEDLRWAVEHPDEVNPIDDEINEWGKVTELSPCTFCPSREPIPATAWMQHYRMRALPMCVPGIISRIE